MVILKSGLIREVRKLAALAVPIIAGQVGQMVLGLVDTIMIGRVGVVPLAAAAFAGTLFSVPLIFGFGILASVSILVARAHGSDRAVECGEFLRHGLVIALVSSTLFACGLGLISGWLDRFGQPLEVVVEARTYFIIISWSLIPVYVFQVLKQFSEALSSAWPPMLVMAGGILLNIVLNWVLIYGNLGVPALGLNGAGWATLIARTSIVVVMLMIVMKAPRFSPQRPLRWLGNWSLSRWRQLLRIGFPVSLQHLAEMGAFAAAALMMGWINAESLAAHQIAISCAAFSFMFPLGLSFAAGIRTGQAIGAGDATGVRMISFSAISVGFFIMACFAIVFLLWGRVIAEQFVDDGVVTTLAARLLIIAGVFQIFDGVQVVSAGLLRGLTDVKVPTVIIVVAYWAVALPGAWLAAFGLAMGAAGIWIGMAAGLAVAAIALSTRVLVQTSVRRIGS